ncbi:MAG TPA: YggS family pyridoxal phosphate-dependent enzyme, partial [Gemmatimonadales bacterium]|nr:YggS family pyridoxal phosphate-dependent enzyme [Gemmatimonadales bacterium]
MPDPDLPRRVAEVRARIAERQARAGWTHPVTIVAVTKTHPAEAVRAAAAAGIGAVGENRVQEALAKQVELTDVAVDWHLIGTLQRNKAKQAVGRFALIHSVDSLPLAQDLAKRVAPGSRQPILIQVNCSAEPQKGGVEPEGLEALVDAVGGLPQLELRGLMTLAELTDDEELQRRTFRRLRDLRQAIEKGGVKLPELSMGMSGDYLAAVDEGTTMVRLGP